METIDILKKFVKVELEVINKNPHRVREKILDIANAVSVIKYLEAAAPRKEAPVVKKEK